MSAGAKSGRSVDGKGHGFASGVLWTIFVVGLMVVSYSRDVDSWWVLCLLAIMTAMAATLVALDE